jgi:hypothetical protein
VVATGEGVYVGMGLWIGCNWLQPKFSFTDFANSFASSMILHIT